MHSMPATPDNGPPCSNPHVDGCPECVENTEPPFSKEDVPNGCQCAYICTDCGNRWSTSWWCS